LANDFEDVKTKVDTMVAKEKNKSKKLHEREDFIIDAERIGIDLNISFVISFVASC
jgi:hypothetical protein